MALLNTCLVTIMPPWHPLSVQTTYNAALLFSPLPCHTSFLLLVFCVFFFSINLRTLLFESMVQPKLLPFEFFGNLGFSKL